MDIREIVIDDTSYSLDAPYLAGARAAQQGVPYHGNPYRFGTQAHEQWKSGHENEAEGHHGDSGVPIHQCVGPVDV